MLKQKKMCQNDTSYIRKIKKIVDNHQVLLNTSYPVFYRAEPVGCTETIMYKLYKENGFEIDKKTAILMLSAIISDTLLFSKVQLRQKKIVVLVKH